MLRDLESGLGPFRRARVLLDATPLPAELEALEKAAGAIPLAIEVASTPGGSPLQALGVQYIPAEKRVAFELLLAPSARTFAKIAVRTGNPEPVRLFRGRPARGSRAAALRGANGGGLP